MITIDDYLNHWRVHYSQVEVPDEELTDEMRSEAKIVVSKANDLLSEFGEDRGITSGWRPIEVNKLIPGAASHSNHVICRAVDIADPGNSLDGWINSNPQFLDELDLWRESPDKTPGWCHIQIVQYPSWVLGKTRTFKP